MSHKQRRAEAAKPIARQMAQTTTGKTVCTLPYKRGESETAFLQEP